MRGWFCRKLPEQPQSQIALGTQAQRTHLATILAQQLSVGLWLMPFAFSKLGWAASAIALSVSSCAPPDRRAGCHICTLELANICCAT